MLFVAVKREIKQGVLWARGWWHQTGKTNHVQYISISVEANHLSHHHREDLAQLNYHQMTGWSGQQYQTWDSVMACAVSKSNTPWWQYRIILGKQKSILLSRLFTLSSHCHVGQLREHYSDWAKRQAGSHLQGRSSWGITYQGGYPRVGVLRFTNIFTFCIILITLPQHCIYWFP